MFCVFFCVFFSFQIVKTIEHRMGRYTQVVLDTCAYAGTGNVLKVQEMLHVCAEHLDENAEHQVGGPLSADPMAPPWRALFAVVYHMCVLS